MELLHKELFEKSKEIIKLRQDNVSLLKKVGQLEADKILLEGENNDNTHKIRRYENVRVKLNRMTKSNSKPDRLKEKEKENTGTKNKEENNEKTSKKMLI